MTPKSAKRFSDQVMRQKNRMIPTQRAALAQSAKRFSDQVMRQKNRMIPTRKAVLRSFEKVALQTREA
jgi:hypothetical protein